MRQRGGRQFAVQPASVIHNESHSMQTESGAGAPVILTIGHSTRSIAEFLRLLTSAPSAGPDRRAHDPALAAQPSVQSQRAVAGSTPRGNSLSPHARAGRAAPRRTSLYEHGLAKSKLPGVCRLHADSAIPKEPGPVYRARETRAGRADVRGSRPLALPSIAHRRCAPRQGHTRE